jgi:hypothetical protein
MSETRKCVLEIDKMAGAKFPPGEKSASDSSIPAVDWDGKKYTLREIYSKAGLDLNVNLNDENIPNLGDSYTESDLIDLMTENSNRARSSGEAGTMYAYLLIVNGLLDPQDPDNPGPSNNILGIMFSPKREGTAVFYKQSNIHREPISYLRTSAHEVGHQFNLHHRDGSVSTIDGPQRQRKYTIMNQTLIIMKYGGTWPNGVSLEFGPLESSHLSGHPEETVAPGASRLGECTSDHEGWHNQAPGRLGVDPRDLTSIDAIPSETEKTDRVNFEIKMGKKEYLPGQPCIAYLRLTNQGSRPVSIIDQLDPRYDVVKFYIKKDEQEKEELFVPYSYIEFIPQEKTLNPGESMHARAKIFYGSKGYSFPEPGTYKVRATYHGITHGLGEIINSNTIDVNIRSPRDKDEEEQMKLINGDQQALIFLFEGGDKLTDGINQLTKLAQKYPNSTLGSYANSVLGLQWSREFKDIRNNRVRKPDHKKASSFLRNAKDNVKGYWADRTFLSLAEIHKKDGNKNSSKKVLDEYISKFEQDSINTNGIERAKKIIAEEM